MGSEADVSTTPQLSDLHFLQELLHHQIQPHMPSPSFSDVFCEAKGLQQQK